MPLEVDVGAIEAVTSSAVASSAATLSTAKVSTMDETISGFLVATCANAKSIDISLMRALVCDDSSTVLTGSRSEFYINPILSCIGDRDIMHNDTERLAVCTSDLKNIQLPSKFKDHIEVYEMVDSGKPAYVFLSKIGVLDKLVNEKRYVFSAALRTVEYYSFKEKLIEFCEKHGMATHGPAIQWKSTRKSSDKLDGGLIKLTFPREGDEILSMYCIEWPKQASDWPTRYREFGWPDAATIDHVVGYGCQIVPVSHRQCSKDEWTSMHLWRISFSRAETILLNSWTPTQQIVYHVLRFVFNREDFGDLKDSTDYKMISKYHIKTLMMWTSETKHSSWWEQNNIVQLCSLLMGDLVDCCKVGISRGYFIRTNLFECDEGCPELTTRLVDRLRPFTDSKHLTDWLFEHYVGECVRRCPKSAEWFDDISAGQPRAATTTTVNRRNHVEPLREMQALIMNQHYFVYHDYQCEDLYSISLLRRLFSKYYIIFLEYFTSMCSLSLASRVDTKVITADPDTVDLVSALVLTFDEYTKLTTRLPSCSFLLRKAVSLMRLSVKSSGTTEGSLKLFLSHAYLRRALTYEDNGSDEFKDVTHCLSTSTWLFCITLLDNTRRRTTIVSK